jgi:hypothetical protein
METTFHFLVPKWLKVLLWLTKFQSTWPAHLSSLRRILTLTSCICLGLYIFFTFSEKASYFFIIPPMRFTSGLFCLLWRNELDLVNSRLLQITKLLITQFFSACYLMFVRADYSSQCSDIETEYPKNLHTEYILKDLVFIHIWKKLLNRDNLILCGGFQMIVLYA